MADTNLIYPYVFEGGKKAVANEVNANFEAVKAFSNGVNATLTDIKTAIADLKNKPTREMFDVYYSFSAETPIGAYPLWTGETITNCKSLYPQFWKKLNSLVDKSMLPTVTNEEYEEKLEEYGQCASFFVDTLNGHVRLPKITKFISSIEDLTQLAEEQKAGLPNITGSLKPYRMGNPDGAFYQDETPDFRHTASKDGSNAFDQYSTKFDASRSSEIYGGSDTVQPPAIRLCLYLQVANNTTEIAELNVDVVIEQMNEALASLETAYNDYYNRLNELYAQIRENIASASPIVKEEDIYVSSGMFFEERTYPDYPFAVDLYVPSATEYGVPTVNFALEQTQSGVFAPISYAGNGFVRIYAKEITPDFVIPSVVVQ